MSDLDWPEGFDRTPASEREPYPHGFRVTRAEAFDAIVEELEKMGGINIRVETAAPHTNRHPHRPYEDRDPEDPGVVAFFERRGDGYAAPCDRWDNLRDNARAIARYLDSKRAIERYGVATVDTEMSTQALPSGDEDVIVTGSGGQKPHEVLEIAPDASEDTIKAVARRKLANAHPDKGGDETEYLRIQRAKEAMLDGD